MSNRMAAAVLLAKRAAKALSLLAFWQPSPAAPGLPGGLDLDEHDSLVSIVRLFFSVRGQRATVRGGQLVVGAGDGGQRFDLAPLLEACSRMPRNAWPDAVAAFLSARLGWAVPEPQPEPAPPVVPPPPPVVEAAEGSGATRGMRRGARPEALAAFSKARLAGVAASKDLLGRMAAFLKPLPGRVAVFLKVLPGRVAVRVKARLRGPLPSLTPVVEAPEQAEPALAAEHWSAFGALVVECLRRHGLAQVKVERGAVLARDRAGHKLRLRAPGLERVPRELRREAWAGWVDGVLGERLRALRGREALSERSFADVRELLAVQLYDEAWLSDEVLAEAVFSREVPGLISALVCRLPQGTFRLSGETVKAWRVEVQEVAQAALANLRRLRPPMQRVMIAPGAEGMRFQGDFAAAQAVLLRENRKCAHGQGALVAVPRRSLLLVCPLRPMAGAAAVYTAAAVSLMGRVLQGEPEGDMPLSRRVYWYRNGAFTELPYEGRLEGGRPLVEFAPGEALAAALAQMR